MHTDDIYSRLLAGESSDDIAAEMTKALNEALDRIEEEEKARKEAELKAAQDKEAANKAKMDAAKDLVADALLFCATYYPSFGLTLDSNVSDEEIEALAGLIVMLLDLEAMRPAKRSFKAKSYKLPVELELNNKEVSERNNKLLSTDEVFAEAFKMLGI